VSGICLVLVTLAFGCGGSHHAKPALATATTVGEDSRAKAGPIPCDLTLRFGSRFEDPPGQFHVDLVVVNKDIVANPVCRVSGYPAVELIGPAYPMYGVLYTLPRQVGRSETVTLRPGESAHSVLTWLPNSDPGDRWVPDYIRVAVRTSRGLSLAMAVPWRYGPVLRQDAATHPGTYIGPIRRGRS
jgi:hypothetical protein